MISLLRFSLASPLLVNDKRRPILHRIFSQTHFQISDNTLIKIAIFPLKAAKNALFWKSIRPVAALLSLQMAK